LRKPKLIELIRARNLAANDKNEKRVKKLEKIIKEVIASERS